VCTWLLAFFSRASFASLVSYTPNLLSPRVEFRSEYASGIIGSIRPSARLMTVLSLRYAETRFLRCSWGTTPKIGICSRNRLAVKTDADGFSIRRHDSRKPRGSLSVARKFVAGGPRFVLCRFRAGCSEPRIARVARNVRPDQAAHVDPAHAGGEGSVRSKFVFRGTMPFGQARDF
jgi:hypothetical protein